jgi:hypothetical protein
MTRKLIYEGQQLLCISLDNYTHGFFFTYKWYFYLFIPNIIFKLTWPVVLLNLLNYPDDNYVFLCQNFHYAIFSSTMLICNFSSCCVKVHLYGQHFLQIHFKIQHCIYLNTFQTAFQYTLIKCLWQHIKTVIFELETGAEEMFEVNLKDNLTIQTHLNI